MTSQTDAVLAWLKSGRVIDDTLARQHLGIARLAARIKNLRDAHYRIDTQIVHRGRKHFAVYRLSDETPPHIL